MRVVKKGCTENEYPKQFICESCGAELEYEKEDEHIGWMGVPYLDCPVCHAENMLDDGKRLIPPTWPKTFHRTSINNAVDIKDDTVQKWIDEVIYKLKSTKENSDYFAMSSGDTLVIGTKNYDDMTIYVTKDFYEDVIFPSDEV